MRSFARTFALALIVLAPVVHAQTPQAKKLYDDALVRERLVRDDLQRARTDDARTSVVAKARVLAGTYEDIARLFPSSGYGDNALWQGAVLAADAFWQFGEATDRATALRLFSALTTRFPSSSLTTKVASQTRRLQDAKPAITSPPTRTAAAVSTPPPAPTGLAALPAALTGITREVLPEVLRIVIQLGKEVAFYDERIGGPPRVFLDLQNTRAIEPLKDAVIPFPDDVVKQVRIGRQPNSRTRVVLDLKGDARYSVYTLYNPYRIVVDFERKRALPAALEPRRASAPEPKPLPVTIAAVTEKPTPAPELKVIATAATTTDAVPPFGEAETTPPPPLPPSTNTNGGFSMSRQLGLGVARIVIDPGHGGHDPGAKARGLEEAELVLDVALRLEALLKDAGVEVIMTRRSDTFIALDERTAIANRVGADLFLSIHSNASASDLAHGVETYFLNFAPNPQTEAIAARENAGGSRTMRNLPDIVRAIALNNKIDESRDFASMVQSALYTKLQKTNRIVRNLGVKQAPFMVLVGATMPSILAEISFITNRQEATLLKTDKYKQQIAEALLAGVLRYQQTLKKVPAIAGR
ncbi:MAG TPA: N-acetylmuramoyl-L-alanine amidase [Vicinamibacterales bacterium]|nr:N-acetylmuramoyl-L-alanine amidase [Vicinamibacterales bacterium]